MPSPDACNRAIIALLEESSMDLERELSELRLQNEALVRMIGELATENAALRKKDLSERLPTDPPAPHGVGYSGDHCAESSVPDKS